MLDCVRRSRYRPTRAVGGTDLGADRESRAARASSRDTTRRRSIYAHKETRGIYCRNGRGFRSRLFRLHRERRRRAEYLRVPRRTHTNDSCVNLLVTPETRRWGSVTSSWASALTLITRPRQQAPGRVREDGDAVLRQRLRDQHGAGGAQNCTTANVANKTVAQAYATCGPPGKNTFLSPPGSSAARHRPRRRRTSAAARWCSRARPPTRSCCTRGCSRLRTRSRLRHLQPGRRTRQGNVTVTLTGTIANSGVAGFGKKLTVPNIDQLALPLDDFYATIKRGSYFQAKCAAGPRRGSCGGSSLQRRTAVTAGERHVQRRPRRAASATGSLGSSDRAKDVARGAARCRPSRLL